MRVRNRRREIFRRRGCSNAGRCCRAFWPICRDSKCKKPNCSREKIAKIPPGPS